MKSLITTALALALLAIPTFASEVGYDSTLGEIHTQVTYSYNHAWDESYAALWGQPSQLVLAGSEALDLINPEPFTVEEWEFLSAVLGSEGSKAILIEDPFEENVKIYVPIPTHSEPEYEIPANWQYRAGVWARGGVLQAHCEWQWVASGSEGTGDGCNCFHFVTKCCSGSCWQTMCQHCYSSDREHLEGLYGPDPRWQHTMPFAEIQPGQRLEIEAGQPY